MEFGTFSFVYFIIAAYLLYSAYRSLRVMRSIKHSYCVIDTDRVYGVSTPDPNEKAIPFDIRRSDICSIEETTVSAAWMRTQSALVLNTQDQKIILLALDRPEELRNELQQKSPSDES